MQQLRSLVEKVAITDANILITGENGTGKEMLAREIHALSSRRTKEMIAVDMGAITESLFESELFGHTKGSFTDAYADRPCKFETAEHSTLFLDEIGNLPYHLQAQLLHDGTFSPIHGRGYGRGTFSVILIMNGLGCI